jgi:hypothetical protein
MTMRRHSIVHRAEVLIRVVVTGHNMVDPVSARTAAQMADPTVDAKDALALRMPRRGEPRPTRTITLPAARHRYLRITERNEEP